MDQITRLLTEEIDGQSALQLPSPTVFCSLVDFFAWEVADGIDRRFFGCLRFSRVVLLISQTMVTKIQIAVFLVKEQKSSNTDTVRVHISRHMLLR